MQTTTTRKLIVTTLKICSPRTRSAFLEWLRATPSEQLLIDPPHQIINEQEYGVPWDQDTIGEFLVRQNDELPPDQGLHGVLIFLLDSNIIGTALLGPDKHAFFADCGWTALAVLEFVAVSKEAASVPIQGWLDDYFQRHVIKTGEAGSVYLFTQRDDLYIPLGFRTPTTIIPTGGTSMTVCTKDYTEPPRDPQPLLHFDGEWEGGVADQM